MQLGRQAAIIALLVAALVAGILAQLPFAPWQSGSTNLPATDALPARHVLVSESVWHADRTVTTPAVGNRSASTASDGTDYYGDADGRRAGIVLVRLGGPLLEGGLVLLVASFLMFLALRPSLSAWTGAGGVALLVLTLILFPAGLSSYNTGTLLNPYPFALDLDWGFWLTLGLTLAALASTVLAFLMAREVRATRDDRPRPLLSADNPAAFDPMRSNDPRPFTPDPPRDFREFERLKPTPRTFRATSGPTKPFTPAKAEQGAAAAPAKPPAPAPGRKPAPAASPQGKGQPQAQASKPTQAAQPSRVPTAPTPPAASKPAAKPAAPVAFQRAPAPAAATGKPTATPPPAKPAAGKPAAGKPPQPVKPAPAKEKKPA